MPILKSLTFNRWRTRTYDGSSRSCRFLEAADELGPTVGDRVVAADRQARARWRGSRACDRGGAPNPAGNVVMCVYHGTKPIEFEKGKAAIAVPSRDKLPSNRPLSRGSL